MTLNPGQKQVLMDEVIYLKERIEKLSNSIRLNRQDDRNRDLSSRNSARESHDYKSKLNTPGFDETRNSNFNSTL